MQELDRGVSEVGNPYRTFSPVSPSVLHVGMIGEIAFQILTLDAEL